MLTTVEPIISVSPDNEEVRDHLQAVSASHPALASLQTVLLTEEGRPIDALTLTDPQTPADQKQHVLIVAGQHGNEETSRLIALKTIDYLLSDAGRGHLKQQKIVVMPNVSPDAAARDAYETPAGIRPNLDHAVDGPVSNEAKAVQSVARQLMPEVYVDIHAKGHVGCSTDMVLFPRTRQYLEDEMLLHGIAQAMAREGERSGIPHVVHPLTWSGWGGDDPDEPSSTHWMYRQFKSLVFLTESAEANALAYPEAMRVASGIGRLKPLLAMGDRRHPLLYHSGYPCDLAAGMFNAGVVAVGRTAAERRQSRLAIWQNVGQFRSVGATIPEQFLTKTLRVNYCGELISRGVGFQMRVAGRLKLRRVAVDGREQSPGVVNGFYSWHDEHTTLAVAAVDSLAPGVHEVEFVFDRQAAGHER